MAGAPGESRIPVSGSGPAPGSGSHKALSSRLISLSHKVRAHLSLATESSKPRSNSSGLLTFLGGPSPRSKAQRPTGLPEVGGVGGAPLGSRVLVAGARAGSLRFLGPTLLGPGLWCGVELDLPDGLNDGSVDGVRYFSCPPRHGLLAPESKVSLLGPAPGRVRYLSEVSEWGPHSLLGLGLGLALGEETPNNDSRVSTPGSGSLPCVRSKHSSFELDESLGILTPDQMTDFGLEADSRRTRTPSCEELSSFAIQDVELSEVTLDSSKRSSLEVRDAETAFAGERTSSSSSKTRGGIKRSPSVEELPLDPERKGGPEEAGTGTGPGPLPNSFVTSVTSIASLDNGYQGDGEWSRPASRGPDHSPSARQKLVEPRIDPMTDSDFFTESDADEWALGRGDRRARVIDGTLYGGVGTTVPVGGGGGGAGGGNGRPNAGAARHRFSPNNEEMDSSGIYSDLERRSDLKSAGEDEVGPGAGAASPEGSTRTVSSDSDRSLKKVSPRRTELGLSFSELADGVEGPAAGSGPVSVSESPRPALDPESPPPDATAAETTPEPEQTKKYKTPKRNAVSKIKTATSNGRKDENRENRVPTRTPKKGRWDEVMDKIAKGQAEEKTSPKLKEVKSKVFAGLGVSNNAGSRSPRSMTAPATRKSSSTRSLAASQSLSTRSLRDIPPLKTKSRRCRLRGSETCLPAESQASSRNSSVSDVSQGTKPSTPTSNRSGKKRDDAGRNSNGTRCASPQAETTPRKQTGQPNTPSLKPSAGRKSESKAKKDKDSQRPSAKTQDKGVKPLKDFNRSTTEPTKQVNETPITKEKGRVEALQPLGPPLPCPAPQPLPKELPKPDNREATLALQRANTGLEALSVLLDYVANRIDGFSAPFLKKELERERHLRIGTQLECEEVKSALNQLRDRFNSEKSTYDVNINKILTEKQEEKFTIESEYKAIISDYEKKIQEIENNSLSQIRQLEDSLNNVTLEKDSLENQIRQQNEEEKEKLLKQKEKYLHDYAQLRKMHQNELCELKSKLLNKFKSTAEKENRFKEELETVVQQHEALQKKISVYQEIINDTPELKNSVRKVKQLESDVSSLKSVLEIRTQELHDLRKKTQHWKQDADELPGAVIKIKTLSARIEDLTAQLSEKEKSEQNLMKENKLLLDSLNNECEQKKRLQMHNEELQWKLRQNIEVANALAKLYGGNYSPTCGASKKSPLRVSNVSSPKAWDVNSDDVPIFDESPPESPRVKAVIQKSDSVSWVVDIDDTPSCVASRLLRRAKSFNRTPPSSNLPPRVCKSLPNHNKRKKLKTSRKEILETDEYIREEVILVKSIGDGNFLQYIEYDDEDAEINIGDSDTSVQNREDDMQNMTELDRLGYLDINLKKAKSLEPRIFPCEPYSPKVAVEKAKSLIELHIKSENRSLLKESGGEAKCEEPDSEFLLHVRSKKNFELDDGIKFEEENITEDNTIMEDKNDLSWSDESYPSEG